MIASDVAARLFLFVARCGRGRFDVGTHLGEVVVEVFLVAS